MPAGFTRIYCISDRYPQYVAESSKPLEAIDNIDLQILRGDGGRVWYEPYYFDKNIKPIGKINCIIPKSPNDKNSLLDACIAFAPKYFESCLTLGKIKTILKNKTSLDFDLRENEIPETWNTLRREASAIFDKLSIFKTNLVPLSIDQRYLNKHYKK